ncbi:MAG: hypothetical protein ACRDGU_08060 [Actinomycetota bacterium]
MFNISLVEIIAILVPLAVVAALAWLVIRSAVGSALRRERRERRLAGASEEIRRD